MKLKNYIALDIHHTHTVAEAQTSAGGITLHRDMPTEPVYLIDSVKSVVAPRA